MATIEQTQSVDDYALQENNAASNTELDNAAPPASTEEAASQVFTQEHADGQTYSGTAEQIGRMCTYMADKSPEMIARQMRIRERGEALRAERAQKEQAAKNQLPERSKLVADQAEDKAAKGNAKDGIDESGTSKNIAGDFESTMLRQSKIIQEGLAKALTEPSVEAEVIAEISNDDLRVRRDAELQRREAEFVRRQANNIVTDSAIEETQQSPSLPVLEDVTFSASQLATEISPIISPSTTMSIPSEVPTLHDVEDSNLGEVVPQSPIGSETHVVLESQPIIEQTRDPIEFSSDEQLVVLRPTSELTSDVTTEPAVDNELVWRANPEIVSETLAALDEISEAVRMVLRAKEVSPLDETVHVTPEIVDMREELLTATMELQVLLASEAPDEIDILLAEVLLADRYEQLLQMVKPEYDKALVRQFVAAARRSLEALITDAKLQAAANDDGTHEQKMFFEAAVWQISDVADSSIGLFTKLAQFMLRASSVAY